MNIKFTVYILFLMLLVIPSVFAQKFEGGIMGGLLGSQVAGDPSAGYHKLGVYGGISVSRHITEKSGLQLEMYFIQKGAAENPTEENGNFQYLLRVRYVEIPILYQFNISKELLLEGGLAFSYLVGTPYEEANFSTAVPKTPFYQSSATFILGLEYRVTQSFSVIFRTNNSITPIRAHASGATRFFNRGQYSDILSLGVSFNIFKF